MRIVAVVCVWFAAAIAFITLPACAGSGSGTKSGTEIPENEYGLEVVDDKDLYLQTVEEDPSKELVDLEEEISGIRLDVRYATENNFMGEQLYPEAKAVLRKPATEFLSEAQEDLKERGLELEVFDGYRPYSVTERMWEPYKDPDFVADPPRPGLPAQPWLCGGRDARRQRQRRRAPHANGLRRLHREGRARLRRPTRRGDPQPRLATRGDGGSRLRRAGDGVVAL